MAEELSDAQIADLRSRMLARRDELRAFDRDASAWQATVELDQQSVGRLSRMDAMQQQAMAKAEAERRRNEATRIESALRRIDDDDYGWCSACGDPIALKRLEIDPTVLQCIGCASG